MNKLNHIEHCAMAARLIESVGGLGPASRITGLSPTSLSNYQNPGKRETMPAKVISDLQVSARTTLYSDAMAGEVADFGIVAADPMHHACGLVKEAAEALGAIEQAMANGNVSAREFSECDKELADVEERVAVLRAGLRSKMTPGSVDRERA